MRKIGIDVDDCLTNLDCILDLYSRQLKYEVKPADLKNFSHFMSDHMTTEEIKSFWDKYLDYYYQNTQVDQVSLPSIRRFTTLFDEVIVLTKRPLWARDYTIQWLAQADFHYDQLILCGQEEKDPYIDRLQLNCMVEDNVNLLTRLSQNRPKVLRVKVDRPWNRETSADLVVKSDTSH